ncbi:4'-phosphopantetheinyl transferase family protein [Falsigemmobacter faecalis]|uniref:Enterobactin synthase component D n=1 Tax=Falsigemmobacter faecalis TaxID=2488730 RepID=A0A3P3DUL8_9RHOB|nr:4'-phosphopantetheinyl transferase superfamily protein [Falsigemmobacter faecalis]RRH77933.1 4'-phosphopantetheinyl transferase superfamily protein [Falsigemmobacter faecalis]
MSRKAAALTLLRGLFPGAVAGFGAAEAAEGGQLYPGEQAGTPGRVVPHRQAEFLAGRMAARAAMADLGFAPAAVPRGADRAPLWPEGLCGSLTHTEGLALAVVLRQGLLSPGLDLEPATDLPAELIPAILTPAERIWAAAQPQPGLAARLIFVAKEAGYKAQYPLSRSLLSFQEAEFEQTTPGRFRLRLLRAAGGLPAATVLEGRWDAGSGFILAGATLPALTTEGCQCSGAA